MGNGRSLFIASHLSQQILQPFLIKIPRNRARQIILLDIILQRKSRSQTRQILQHGRWNVVARLAIDEKCVEMRREGERCGEHVWGDCETFLEGEEKERGVSFEVGTFFLKE